VPVDYYHVRWLGFHGSGINARQLPLTVLSVDSSNIRLQSGVDSYVNQLISRGLDSKQRAELAREYRTLRQDFRGREAVKELNVSVVGEHDDITDGQFSLDIDLSMRSAWESTIVPHIDNVPFQYVGEGERSALKILLSLKRQKQRDDAVVVLIEEPENHLSFSKMNQLIRRVSEYCGTDGSQVIMATHSSHVANKLGLSRLILLGDGKMARLKELPSETNRYFEKLSGYDTLRAVLAVKVILVEGPSDELIVQRAYRDMHDGRLPIEDAVDVINVRGLSAPRFLDLTTLLKIPAVVVTDNDDKEAKQRARYDGYDASLVAVCVSPGSDGSSLEDQLVAVNDLEVMNAILGKTYLDEAQLLGYMKENKTEVALKIFDSKQTIKMPEYIRNAVA
jgi:ABC-type cobalamin/Fe3+-siderophores transport system ATPase subunit